MRTSIPAVTASAAIAIAVTLHARQEDKVVPVHQEPRHHLVFENATVRMLDIQIPPGDTTLFHTHSDPILYINMSSSQTRSQVLGKDWSGGNATPAAPARPAPPTPPGIPPAMFGRMNSVTTYPTQPLTHRVNNIGKDLFRLIGVINRTAGDEGTDPSADFSWKPAIDNRWFRGYHAVLGGGPPPDEHRHANPVALVLVKGTAVVTADKVVPLNSLGAFVFLEPGVKHTVKTVGSPEAGYDGQVVEVEVRRPRS